jgi:multidrug efflux pump subunit AcrA (membrane-fusion protein)
MFTKYILPIIAVAGLVFAVMFVRAGNKPVPASQPVAQPAQAPFSAYVAGAGIVEAASENIAVGTLVPGGVQEICVKVGTAVKKGDPLFKIDDRDLQAELLVRKSALLSAQERLAKLQAMPRAEDIPPAEAKVAQAQADLNEAHTLYEMWRNISDPSAVSAEELKTRRFNYESGQAKLKQAEAELALLKAGAWKPDLEIAQAEVTAAEAQVKAVETQIDRLTVRAPVDGEVLQVKVRLGEFAPTGVLATPLMLIGDVETLHVRVDIDENDAWRLKPNAPARAFLRGNRDLATDLKFFRVEPYVVPKRSLTGESTERVDTRVLQVLYSFDRNSLPVYVGQQMDVFIEAEPVGREPRDKR